MLIRSLPPYTRNKESPITFTMSKENTESFRPFIHTAPDTLFGILKFYGRMLLDLQILTIYKDIKRHLPYYSGNVLDVGCGQSPYRFLLNSKESVYFGIDVSDSCKFDYNNAAVMHFDGENIPFCDEKFDGLICTEVLEHVHNYQKLIGEMYRVMKVGAKGIVTVPWSARYHYIPHDFFRYTPSALKVMFGAFVEVRILARGADVSNIANKLIVLWFRNLLPREYWRWLLTPLWIALSPILIGVVILAHISLIAGLGSDEDPLGYTILIRK